MAAQAAGPISFQALLLCTPPFCSSGVTHKISLTLLAASLLLGNAGCGYHPDPEPKPDSLAIAAAREEVLPTGLPRVGKWMIAPDSAPAHWLNEIYEGKHLREPINVIILDSAANSVVHARERLLAALVAAGFPARLGHSSGYSAMIADTTREQLMDGSSGTFADEPFEFNNDHGRIFGPYEFKGAYVWTASLSREKIAPLSSVKHEYVSFNRAREAFVLGMEQKTTFHAARSVPLNNTLLNDANLTSGDHDGMAALLVAPTEIRTLPSAR